MEIFIISIVAFLVAILTFFSGFGLGTILTPVFMIFFPVNIAIGLTGVVHFFNNLFKLFLVGKKADRKVVLRFGIPAVIAAALGSWLLLNISDIEPLFTYTLWDKTIEVFPVKFIVAVLLILFACIDLIPYFSKLEFGQQKLPLGGVLSGFFGGLAGVQGALRSAFLIKAGLSKESFIATTVVVSTFVDITRLSVYTTRFDKAGLTDNLTLVICATLSATIGAYVGNKLLKKVTLHFVKVTVAVLLILISLGLGSGLI
nr:sulfite exporter TauE/SafE family protein [uncultured Flavobacterium sp.]